MSDIWPTATIGSLIDDGSITGHKDGNHGAKYPRAGEFGDKGIPFLTAKHLDDSGNIDIDSAPRLSAEKAKNLTIGYIETGDVLLSHNATVGRVALVPQLDGPVLIGTSLTYFRVNPERIWPGYLAACLSGIDFQNQLKSVMSQTTRNQVPITAQRKLSIVVPPLDEQRRIAQVLLLFDDAIRVKQQTNQTLEKIAKTIFQSWFVDFEPVKAKEHVRNLGGNEEQINRAAQAVIAGAEDLQQITNATELRTLDQRLIDVLREKLRHQSTAQFNQLANTSRQFPDQLVESNSQMIPSGWRTTHLGEQLDVLETGSRPKGGVKGITEGVPSVGAENILGIGRYEYGKEKFVSEEFFGRLKRGVVKSGDVLLYKDGGKPGDFRPRVSMFGCGFPYEKFAVNEHVFRLRSDHLGQAFLYLQICHENVLFELRHKGGKAAIPGINQTDVKTIQVTVPNTSLLEAFDVVADSLLTGILENSKDSQSLARVRDILLPKLLAGVFLEQDFV